MERKPHPWLLLLLRSSTIEKKINFVQDREIGISTGLSRDSLIE